MASYIVLASSWTSAESLTDGSEAAMEMLKYPEISLPDLRGEIRVCQNRWNCATKTVDEMVQIFREADNNVRSLFPNFLCLLRLLLVRPASSVECERSFSALRRLKTWLRSTMSQTRLNSAAILNVHQTYTDNIDLEALVSEFATRNDWRKKTF